MVNCKSRWNAAQRDATPAQFRKMLEGSSKEEVKNAMVAGRSLARLMQNGDVILIGIDDVQLERYRRRYAVPQRLKAVMYAVATAKLDDAMLEERLNRKMPSYQLTSGRIMLVERCQVCAKRQCRCYMVNQR